MGTYSLSNSRHILHALDELKSGTLVIWTDLDRIIPTNTLNSNEIAKGKFLEQMEKSDSTCL